MPQLPAYPQILTQTDWNNKKGVVAKIVAVPTKLGDALKALEAAYKAVDFAKVFDAPSADIHKIDERLIFITKTVVPQYNDFKTAMKTAKTHAEGVREEWKKNKLIPSASKSHLDKLITEFTTFLTNVETQQKAAYKVLTDARQGLAVLNPNDAAKSNQGANQVVVKPANAAKTEGIKTKFKQQPAPASGVPQKQQ
jgi:hypothetical protein